MTNFGIIGLEVIPQKALVGCLQPTNAFYFFVFRVKGLKGLAIIAVKNAAINFEIIIFKINHFW